MKRDLRAESKKFHAKLSKIKIALFDVDGILTDSKVYWDGDENGFNRCFNTYDGYGLKTLQRAGLKVGIITGGDSIGVKKRFEGLGVDYLKMGTTDKREGFEEIMADCGFNKLAFLQRSHMRVTKFKMKLIIFLNEKAEMVA
jgi:3-deoxy-D-manno-octulosonate 8-phosphate phosphatase (KDO 8-P phosphatase)